MPRNSALSNNCDCAPGEFTLGFSRGAKQSCLQAQIVGVAQSASGPVARQYDKSNRVVFVRIPLTAFPFPSRESFVGLQTASAQPASSRGELGSWQDDRRRQWRCGSGAKQASGVWRRRCQRANLEQDQQKAAMRMLTRYGIRRAMHASTHAPCDATGLAHAKRSATRFSRWVRRCA